MLKCKECDFDNPIEARFCRSCGEEIEIDEFSKNDIQNEARERKKQLNKEKHKGEWGFFHLILIVIFLSIAAFIIGLLYSSRTFSVVSMKSLPESQNKYNLLTESSKSQAENSIAFSSEELSAIFKERLLSTLPETNNTIETVSFEVVEDKLNIYILSNLFGIFGVTYELNDVSYYKIKEVKIGSIPLHKGLVFDGMDGLTIWAKELTAQQFKYILESKKVKKIFEGIKFFKVQEGNIVIETGKPFLKPLDEKEDTTVKE